MCATIQQKLQRLNCLLLRIVIAQFKSIWKVVLILYTVTVDPKMSFSLWSVAKTLQCLPTAGLHITIIAVCWRTKRPGPSVNTQNCLMVALTGIRYSDWPPYIHASSAIFPWQAFIHPLSSIPTTKKKLQQCSRGDTPP